MKIVQELLSGCYLLSATKKNDERGFFIKTFQKSAFKEIGIDFQVQEEYYSSSLKNVVRGMHFQVPPYAHDKLVYCLSGEAIDVLLDLRKGGGYGKVVSINITSNDGSLIFIPKGVAHGFLSLVDNTVLVYKTSTEYSPEFDQGILWGSFDFASPSKDLIISARDRLHPRLSQFDSPF